MRKATRIAAVLALAPLLLLAASGLALAHWDDQIDVNGSVALGVFNMQMSDHGGWDNETPPTDVGTFSTSLVDNDDGDDIFDGGVGDLFTFTIANAYPGYEACFEFDVTNAGTIPAQLQAAAISIIYPGMDPGEDEYIYVALYHDADDVADGSIAGDDLVAEKPILSTTWSFAGGAADLLGAFQNLGLDTVNPGATQIYTVCVGISADPNAPETMMTDSFSVEITLDYVQAVP